VGNTAEETCRCPNQLKRVRLWPDYVNPQISPHFNPSAKTTFKPKTPRKTTN